MKEKVEGPVVIETNESIHSQKQESVTGLKPRTDQTGVPVQPPIPLRAPRPSNPARPVRMPPRVSREEPQVQVSLVETS